MENLGVNPTFWRGKRVFLTGHTGFKGGWLSLWLESLGAQVCGFALPPPTEPSFFRTTGIEALLTSHVLGDVMRRACSGLYVATVPPDASRPLEPAQEVGTANGPTAKTGQAGPAFRGSSLFVCLRGAGFHPPYPATP